MIDFRYHIVSIVAVFLALAVGIVLGSGPLKDDISGFLEDRTAELAREKVDLQGQVADLRSNLESADSYTALTSSTVLEGLLVGQAVVTVVLPNASEDTVNEIETAIADTGARVTARIEIDQSWTEPDQQELLGRVSEDLERGPGAADPYALAGRVLSGALVTENDRLIGQPFSPSIGILTAYEDEGFLNFDDSEIARAGSAVVIGSDSNEAAANETLLPLVDALNASSEGAVLAAPTGSAEPEGVVGLLRASDLSDSVSTVDCADLALGVTTSVLALVDQRQGTVGHYGLGPDAQGAAPDPIPGT